MGKALNMLTNHFQVDDTKKSHNYNTQQKKVVPPQTKTPTTTLVIGEVTITPTTQTQHLSPNLIGLSTFQTNHWYTKINLPTLKIRTVTLGPVVVSQIKPSQLQAISEINGCLSQRL